MKIKDISGYSNLEKFVKSKIERLGLSQKNFETLFNLMFEQEQNVMAENSLGFRINKITYGQCKSNIIEFAGKLKKELSSIEKSSLIGLYMDNGIEWIQAFWAILMCGYNPLLMNLRLSDEQLENSLIAGNAKAVISDSKEFSVKTLNYFEISNEIDSSPLSSWGEEIYFMSSGTSENLKLCAYSAENFYYQIFNTMDIIKKCPQIKSNYKGHIKILALLPFYHVFGFVAVYLWFGFFARTFVFLKDLSAQTLLNTVKKHQVTHVFAVPMVWEKIYNVALKKIVSLGEKTYNKFSKAIAIANKNALIGKAISKFAFKEIREKIFGDSIRFLISGGSAISKEALEFLNGIGYYAVNGYGMTEIAITSVETSKKRRERNLASIGSPFGCVEYKIEDGELLVKSKSRACKIIVGDKIEQSNLEDWFNTKDLAKQIDGKYYLIGRKDDLIISASGENISPQVVESTIKIEGVVDKVLIKDELGAILILQISGWMPVAKLKEIENKAIDCLKKANVQTEIKKIILTKSRLLEPTDFKISRSKISKRLKENQIEICSLQEKTEQAEFSELEQELSDILLEIIGEDKEIYPESNFFIDLNASSLDYFSFIATVKDKFNLKQGAVEGKNLTTIKEFADIIIKEYK